MGESCTGEKENIPNIVLFLFFYDTTGLFLLFGIKHVC